MKRRTFLKTSAAAAAVASIQGCGSDSSNEDIKVDNSAKHTVNISYVAPSQSVDSMLEGLTDANRALAEAYILEQSIDSSNKATAASKYYFHSGVAKEMTKSTKRSDDDIDLHVISSEFSSLKATLFYITHELDTPADDGRTYGLNCLYLYIPESANIDDTDGSVDITIDNPVDETIKALLFMHPSLSQLDATRAQEIVDFIDLDTLNNVWKTQIELTTAMSDDSWYTATVLSDPSTSEAYQFSDGANVGTSIYKFLPTETIADTLADPLYDLMSQVSNDSTISSFVNHNKATSDTIDSTRSRMQRWRNSLRETTSSTDAITIESSNSKSGYVVELESISTYADAFSGSDFDADTPVVKITMKNGYRRFVSFYAEYQDLDGNAITVEAGGESGGDAWELMGGDSTLYGDNTHYSMATLPGPSEVLSIPIADYYTEDMSIVFHPDANSIVIYGATAGSYGDRSSTMETFPAAMTITFDMIIPTMLLALSASIQDEGAWEQLVLNDGAAFVTGMVEAILEASSNGGFSSKQLATFAIDSGVDLIYAVLSVNAGDITTFLLESFAESEVEDSVPIIGIALMVANVIVDASELAQTSDAIANSAWVSSTTLTRTHTVSIQVLPDEDNFEFPESSDTVTLILQSPQGKVYQEVSMSKDDAVGNVDTSIIVDQTLFADGSGSTVEALQYTFDNVPEGGEISISALFTSGTEYYVVGYAKLTGITNLDSPTVAFRIEQILVTLSNDSIYAHSRKLSYSDAGALEWTETTTAPTTVNNLRSDGTTDNEISKLLSIAINDKSGALGYSFTTEIDGVFKTISKNVSAKSDAPTEGLKELTSTSDTNAFVLYDMLAEPEISDENFILLLKDGVYYAKSVTISTDASDFGISDTKNFGKFSATITAAAYDSVNRVIAGVDSKNKRLHILTLSDSELDDSDTTAYGQRLSIPCTSVASSSITQNDYNSLNDLLSSPSVVSFSPSGRLFVVDQTDTNDYIKVFNAHGIPLLYSGFNSSASSVLKSESGDIEYLDLSVDSEGYFFILKTVGSTDEIENYKLDLYAKDGTFLAQTSGMAAHKMHADYWRNVYTLNYEQTTNDGHSEPTISIWVPPVTSGSVISDYE